MSKQPEALRIADAIDEVFSGWVAEAATELRRLHQVNQVLRAERSLVNERYEFTVKLLTSIHLLMYPEQMALPDGRTLVFRPSNPDPHTVLQELSDRIRALPDEIAAIAKAERESK